MSATLLRSLPAAFSVFICTDAIKRPISKLQYSSRDVKWTYFLAILSIFTENTAFVFLTRTFKLVKMLQLLYLAFSELYAYFESLRQDYVCQDSLIKGSALLCAQCFSD
ncbi:hypothetical protein SUGI_1135220 [Cryptomeria japonica]|nr:hypothetical protein SUGI_1135220 [Cryptomeria japonica]